MSQAIDKKLNKQEQRTLISNFMEFLNYSIQVYDCELGNGKNIPKFVQHDTNTYSVVLVPSRRKLKFSIEIE